MEWCDDLQKVPSKKTVCDSPFTSKFIKIVDPILCHTYIFYTFFI